MTFPPLQTRLRPGVRGNCLLRNRDKSTRRHGRTTRAGNAAHDERGGSPGMGTLIDIEQARASRRAAGHRGQATGTRHPPATRSPSPARYPPATNHTFFSRSELGQLLSLYSRRVVNGEWRDYAIDHDATEATVSFLPQRGRASGIRHHQDGGAKGPAGPVRAQVRPAADQAVPVARRSDRCSRTAAAPGLVLGRLTGRTPPAPTCGGSRQCPLP